MNNDDDHASVVQPVPRSPDGTIGTASGNWMLLPVTLVVAVPLVFVVPWWFPPRAPVTGFSYDFGFNNRVAIVGLMAAIGLGAVCRVGVRRSPDALQWFNDRIVPLPSFSAAGEDYIIAGTFAALMGLVTMRLYAWLVNPYWGESGFFLSRIDLLDMGFTPYVDFQHNHGPLTLYVPWWLQRCSLGLLGLEDAYAATVVAGYVLGFTALLVFFQAIALSGTARFVAMMLSCMPWTCSTLGLNYVPLRFFITPAALVVLHAVVQRSRAARVGAAAQGALAALIACAASLGMSPEMGFATAAGIAAYAAVLWKRSEPVAATALLASAATAIVGVVVLVPGYAMGLRAFVAGSNNFPVYPNLHNVLFMVTCLMVMCPLLAASWTHPEDGRAPLAASLCAAGGLLIAPALGRADPGHVIVNSVIPLTIMFAAAFHLGPRAGWTWATAYLAVAVVAIHMSYRNHYEWLYREADAYAQLVRANPGVQDEWRLQWEAAMDRLQGSWRPAWSKVVPCPVELVPLVESHSVSLPVAAAQHIGFDRLVKLQRRFQPQYHPIPVPEMFSPVESARTAQEALRNDIVILPSGAKRAVETKIDFREYEKMVCRWLSDLLLYPVRGAVIHEPFLPEQDVYRRVLAAGKLVSAEENAPLIVKPIRGDDH